MTKLSPHTGQYQSSFTRTDSYHMIIFGVIFNSFIEYVNEIAEERGDEAPTTDFAQPVSRSGHD